MSPADLAADSGRCLADLGQRQHAHRLMDQGVALLPTTRTKTHAVFLTYQAENHLRDGQPQIAAHTAARALTLATRIDSSRCTTMVRDLQPLFTPHTQTPEVTQLLTRLRAAQP